VLSDKCVLSRASAGGRAASMYWNVNALTRLSFAEHGQVLLSEEPFDDLEAPPAVAPTLAGLDFGDHRRRKPLMGMLAVQRCSGAAVHRPRPHRRRPGPDRGRRHRLPDHGR